MKVGPLKEKHRAYLSSHRLKKAYDKQVALFEVNPRHPSLHYEIMRGTEGANPTLRSFRLTQKYRIVGYELGSEFIIVAITNHYS